MSGSAFRAGQPGARRPSADMQLRRQALPIYHRREQIISRMRKSRVVILQAGIGSGKTTQLPQYILEEIETLAPPSHRMPGLIGCTQPRVIATMASARRVAQERNCAVGEEVGYHVRFDNSSSDRTRILFMTDGIIVQKLLDDPLLKKYAFIVLDEAHVHSVSLDFLVPRLRETVVKRDDFKLLISSAAIDADRFPEYFGAPGPICPALPTPVSVILVDGQNYPVDVFYDTSVLAAAGRYNASDPKRYMRHAPALAAALKVKEIVERADIGDILIFLPGQEEIEECCEELQKVADKLHALLDIHPLFGALPSLQQNDVLKAAPEGRRKVVAATNIAETSLTIDGIIHVIDSDLSKQAMFSPVNGFHWIDEVKIIKRSAIQRVGRAGRTAPGICYRLYSQDDYE